jgi:hypothetical protein
MALECFVEETGVLQDPHLRAMAECWLRVECAAAARRFIIEEETASVDTNDIDFWRENSGVLVWFSSDTPTPEGPFSIAGLPRDLALALRQLAPGQSASVEGYGTVTLDSLFQAPGLTGNPPDSVAAGTIGGERERFHYLHAYALLLDGGETGIIPGYSDLSALPPDSVVVYSPLGRWNRRQIETEMAFLRTRFPFVEASAQWSGMMLENLVMQSHYRNVLVSDYPAVADSLREASLEFLESQAAESVVRQYLDSTVTVTRADIEEEYSLLAAPPISAETRVFHMASAGVEELPHLRRALGDLNGLEDFPGVPELAPQGGDQRVSRPLMSSEISGETASVLFGISGTDTASWFGPFEIAQGCYAAFRLREVIPPHPSTIEEMEAQLNQRARSRLEAEEMDSLFTGIRRRYQVLVNDEILKRLSPNPDQWDDGA